MKQVFGTPVVDYLPGIGLLLFTIGYLATAYNYDADARAVPAGVAWVMLVLGASAERNFHQSMLMSDNNYGIYLNRPICLLLLAGIVVLLLMPIVRGLTQQIAGIKTSPERGSA